MGDWAELPKDLLILIAKRITVFEDFLDFGGVCRSWRSVAIKDHFKGSEKLPWLMLSNKDKPDERQFVSLRKGGVIRTVNLPEARGKRCLESLGWLVTISEDGDMSLLHPFTRAQINLPHVTTFKNYDFDRLCRNDWHSMKDHHSFIPKAILSSCPKDSKDYVLVVIYTGLGCLAFWRPGDHSWTDVEAGITSFSDIIFDNRLFYGVIRGGMVFAFDLWGSNPTRPWLVLLRGPLQHMGGTSYIVESAGVVLIIFPKYESTIFDNEEVDYWVCGFKVFESNLSGEIWDCVEKRSLGDSALFLGDNASISVDASRFPGIKANCIYFTDNFKRRGGSYCMGIYDMEDGSLRRCYEGESSSLIFPPTWVNPSSF